jgi:glutathione S-transferase|tara:strand:- start:2040 stop:2651 length:612 start_codon:yes stop_codon:yes gene_type:complete
MKLYTTEGAPNPRRVRIFLSEKGINVPMQEISIMKQEHKTDEYRKISPFSRLPALVLEDGSVLLESVAICRYFELLNPEPSLFGKTDMEQVVIEMQNRKMELEILMTVAGAFRHTHPAFSKLEKQNTAFGLVQKDAAEKRLKYLDKELADKQYIAGKNFSIADITCLCAIDFCRPAKIEIPEDYKNLNRWIQEIKERPSSQIV